MHIKSILSSIAHGAIIIQKEEGSTKEAVFGGGEKRHARRRSKGRKCLKEVYGKSRINEGRKIFTLQNIDINIIQNVFTI